MKLKSCLSLALAGLLLLARECPAYTIYLQTENPAIAGDITAKGFEGAWLLSSFSHGITLPISTGPSREPGQSEFADFAIVKFLDKASALLLLQVAEGSPIEKIHITFRTISASPATAYKITLENVLVSSISQSTAAGTGNQSVAEALKFNFAKIIWTYTPVDPDTGKPGTPITRSWNLVTGMP